MTVWGDPLVWTALWIVAAAALSALPSRRGHWPLAVALAAAGVPILWFAVEAGWLRGAIALGAGALVLRWPLRRAAARLRGALGP